MRRKVPPGQHLREIPQARARPAAKSIRHYAREYADRDSAIAAAYASGAHTMKGIGDYFGLHYSRVSKIVQNAEETMRKKKRDLTAKSLEMAGYERTPSTNPTLYVIIVPSVMVATPITL
jgi:hypothetical protein